VSTTWSLLIIGGGPAGLAAARGFREAGGAGPVAILADEGRMPYSRPPLTKELLRGEIDADALPLEAETWLAEQAVTLIAGSAAALDPADRAVSLEGGRRLRYRSCVLATGAAPVRLRIPGADDPAVLVVRTLDHVQELQARLGDGDAVVVIGSGFIGCEIAASLAHRGHVVTLVSDEALPNARRLGTDAGRRIAQWLVAAGVQLVPGVGVEAIARQDDGTLVVSAGAHRLRSPHAVMAAGVAPRSELVSGHGVALDHGAVVTDAGMRTAVPGLLAAGDVTFAENRAAGRHLHVEHWGDALGQGTVAGHVAAGREDAWREVPGFWSTIAGHTLKYIAWGDGHDAIATEDRGHGAFVIRYGRHGRLVGVLTHQVDAAYDTARELIAAGAPGPTPL
jgi:NADPH-dependent 2,4-dienoyl-CoA reductase/sulfur reductase-like enzyme